MFLSTYTLNILYMKKRGEGLKKCKLIVDSHGDGEHSVGKEVSINMMAKGRAKGRME